MKNYKIITGFIRYQSYDEKGNPIGEEQEEPYAPYNVIAESKTIAIHLASELDLPWFEVKEELQKPDYFNYELN